MDLDFCKTITITVFTLFLMNVLTACSDSSDGPLVGSVAPFELVPPTANDPWKLVFDYPLEQEGSLARWTTDVKNGAGAHFSVAKNGLKEDSYSLRVDIHQASEDSPWDIQVFQDAVDVIPLTIYRYALWVMGPRGTVVGVGIENGNYQSIKNKRVYLMGEWQEVVIEFYSEQDIVRTPIHFSFPENLDANILIDNVSLVKLP